MLLLGAADRERNDLPHPAPVPLLVRLLGERPTAEFFGATFRALRSVMHMLPPGLREVEHRDLLDSCEHVARASGGDATRGMSRHKVCLEERRRLDRLASELRTGARRPTGGAKL